MDVMHILIANPHHAAYQHYKQLFQAERDMVVVGHATCSEELLYQVAHSDVVLLEVNLARERTPDLVRKVRRRAPDTRVLLTGIEQEQALIEQATILRYVEAGAIGYILTQEVNSGLLRKVRAAGDGQALVSPRIAAHLISHLARLSARRHPPLTGVDAGAFDRLTPRQQEVLTLLGDGLTNQEIAQRLDIKLGTVKNHVHHIFGKLQVDNRYRAASVYRRWQQKQQELQLSEW